MRRPDGFALLAALWLLVAFSIASLGLSVLARERRLAAANLVERTRAVAAAAAGIEQLRSRLARRLTLVQGVGVRATAFGDPWHGVDSVFSDTVALDAARYAVNARDLGAALNLNRASEDMLRRLFVALRVDAGEADRLAQCILDWRDPDDFPRARGAERDAYLRASAPMLPRNGPFQGLAELLFVQGMTRDIYARVRPFLTVLGSGQVNLNAADRPVLLALPGMTEEAVAVLLRYRRQRRVLANLTDLERDLSPGPRHALVAALPELLGLTTTEAREVQVTSTGWLPGSPVRAQVTGLLVRAGGAVFYVWSRTE
jgi:general secretion pathway protein K